MYTGTTPHFTWLPQLSYTCSIRPCVARDMAGQRGSPVGDERLTSVLVILTSIYKGWPSARNLQTLDALRDRGWFGLLRSVRKSSLEGCWSTT